ncbi:MAG: hypothetical protein ACF8XB_06200 [Planctomycetota bacterium JB042]
MSDRTSSKSEERALVLGSMLDTGRGTVLLVEERTDVREQIALRLLSAGYRIVAGRTGAVVAREAIGQDVAAVVASAGAAAPPTPFDALDVVRFGAPMLLLVGGAVPAPTEGLPSGALVVRAEGSVADVESAVVEALETAVGPGGRVACSAVEPVAPVARAAVSARFSPPAPR